jgi:PAS domain S-box-containing protein
MIGIYPFVSHQQATTERKEWGIMNLSSNNLSLTTPASISEDCFGGYHRCCLEKPYHLDYASPDLCKILGYTAEEMHTRFQDKYSQMIYEKDRPKYLTFISKLASMEQTLNIQYRMVCKDGHIIHINDTMTSRRLEDGKMYGFAVISDESDTPPKYSFSDFSTLMNQLMESYGFIQCTCEKYPKITHINQQMERCLTVSDSASSSNWMEFLKENIYFMIPLEDRDYFKGRLDRALHETQPTHLNHQILRSDGSKILLNGWLSVIENEYGESEYTIIYMNTESAQEKTDTSQNNTYLQALKSAYHLIFELNLEKQTVECIHGRQTSAIGALSDIDMTIDSAKKFWLSNHIVKDDIEMMTAYLDQITTPGAEWNESHVLQTEFRVDWPDHSIYHLLAIAIQLNNSTVLLCCRNISNLKYSGQTKERVTLDKLYRWLERYFVQNNMGACRTIHSNSYGSAAGGSDGMNGPNGIAADGPDGINGPNGIAANGSADSNRNVLGMMLFECSSGNCGLLYMSQNIMDYMHINQNEYLRYTSGELSLKRYLEAFGISNDQFNELLQTGQIHVSLQLEDQNEPKPLMLTCVAYKSGSDTLYEIFIFDDENVAVAANSDTANAVPQLAGVSGMDTLPGSDKNDTVGLNGNNNANNSNNAGSIHGSNNGNNGSNAGSVHGSNNGNNAGSVHGSNNGNNAGNAGSIHGNNNGNNAGSIHGSNNGSNAGSIHGSNNGSNAGSIHGSNNGNNAGDTNAIRGGKIGNNSNISGGIRGGNISNNVGNAGAIRSGNISNNAGGVHNRKDIDVNNIEWNGMGWNNLERNVSGPAGYANDYGYTNGYANGYTNNYANNYSNDYANGYANGYSNIYGNGVGALNGADTLNGAGMRNGSGMLNGSGNAGRLNGADTLNSTGALSSGGPIAASKPSAHRIFARTFGHFDLFIDNIAVTFSSSKEKELMALLIDRNGGTLSTSEAISYLWENEEANKQVSARYRKLAMGLKNTLTKYGIEYILINNRGVRSIDTSAITCDYYELLAGNKKYQDSFHNAYMTDYSWAEETLATLWDYS